MASTNLPGKLSRAVCHYLVGLGVVSFDRAYPSTTRRQRDLANGPIVTVAVMPGSPLPPMTGNNRFEVRVFVEGSAVKHPDDTNDETERLAFDEMVGAVRDALMQTDDNQTLKETRRLINEAAYTMPVAVDSSAPAILFAQNNADMDNFTLLEWYDGVYGQTESKDCDWTIALGFQATACEEKLTGYV